MSNKNHSNVKQTSKLILGETQWPHSWGRRVLRIELPYEKLYLFDKRNKFSQLSVNVTFSVFSDNLSKNNYNVTK
jgi:hypothetical protein